MVTGVIACTADKGADFSKLEHLAAGGDDMVAVARRAYAVARLGELKVLNEFNGTLYLLLDRPTLALFLDGTFASKPIW